MTTMGEWALSSQLNAWLGEGKTRFGMSDLRAAGVNPGMRLDDLQRLVGRLVNSGRLHPVASPHDGPPLQWDILPAGHCSRPADRIYTEPDRTGREPEITELVLDWDRESGGGMIVVRLTPADREGVLAALADPEGLLKWRQAARNVARGVPVPSARLAEEHAGSVDALVTEAYAGGYALAVQDCLATSQAAEGVRDFLHDLLESGPAPGEDWDHNDVEAIERVRALLES